MAVQYGARITRINLRGYLGRFDLIGKLLSLTNSSSGIVVSK